MIKVSCFFVRVGLFFVLSIASICNAKFETSHLPLAENISSSFPKLKATCFIIANSKASVIVHEKNSNYKIHGGTFNRIVASSISEEKTTLYDMCCVFVQSFETLKKTTKVFENIQGIDICFFKSAMSGVGCAFKYKNKNSCEFFCVLYGLSTKGEAMNDAKAISNWLDQFFIFHASSQGDLIAEIPVFYGKCNKIRLTIPENHLLLMSQNYSKQATKILRYRTVLSAPIRKGDDLGMIFYVTEIFKNPVSKQIVSNKEIKKANILKVIKDSFAYSIFGASYYEGKIELGADYSSLSLVGEELSKFDTHSG